MRRRTAFWAPPAVSFADQDCRGSNLRGSRVARCVARQVRPGSGRNSSREAVPRTDRAGVRRVPHRHFRLRGSLAAKRFGLLEDRQGSRMARMPRTAVCRRTQAHHKHLVAAAVAACLAASPPSGPAGPPGCGCRAGWAGRAPAPAPAVSRRPRSPSARPPTAPPPPAGTSPAPPASHTFAAPGTGALSGASDRPVRCAVGPSPRAVAASASRTGEWTATMRRSTTSWTKSRWAAVSRPHSSPMRGHSVCRVRCPGPLVQPHSPV